MKRTSSRFRRELGAILGLGLAGIVAAALSFRWHDARASLAAVALIGAFVACARLLLRCRECSVPIVWMAMEKTSAFGWDHPLQHVNPCPRCGARQ